VIEPATGAVLATVPMGGRPEYAVADGKGTIYDNILESSEVAVLDTRTLAIRARWPIAPSGTPAAMSMDRDHRRLLSEAENPQLMAVMDADNGKVITTLSIGSGADAISYDPETNLIFCSTHQGTIHVFHEDSPKKFSTVTTLQTEPGARTMALDLKTIISLQTQRIWARPIPRQKCPTH